MIEYLEDNFSFVAYSTFPFKNCLYYTGRTVKATPYVVQVPSINNRYRRVYSICFSNAASHYITIKGKKYFIKYSFTLRDLENITV